MKMYPASVTKNIWRNDTREQFSFQKILRMYRLDAYIHNNENNLHRHTNSNFLIPIFLQPDGIKIVAK